MKSYEHLLVDVDAGVATVTLNRPEAMNAFNFAMTAEFDDAIWSLERDDAVRVIVLTGAGKAFSTGLDLATGGDAFGADAHERHNEEVGASDSQITDRYAFWTMRTPMIAAINGMAIGAGLTTTFLADIRIVADDARLRLPLRAAERHPRRELDLAAPAAAGSLGPWSCCSPAGGSRTRGGGHGSGVEGRPRRGGAARRPGDGTRHRGQHRPGRGGRHEAAGVQEPDGDRSGRRVTEETKLTWWAGSQPDTMEGVTALMTKRTPQWTQSKHLPIPDDLPEQ